MTRHPTPTLVTAVDCRYCHRPVYLALCRDGKRRTFERKVHPPAPSGVWGWRKGWGMEEQDLVPGHVLHYCAEYRKADPAQALADAGVTSPVRGRR